MTTIDESDPQFLDSAIALVARTLKTGAMDSPYALETTARLLAHSRENCEARVGAMLDAARCFYVCGDPEIGIRAGELAKTYAIQTHQDGPTIAALILIGVCSADTGDIPRAMEAYAEGLNLAIRAGDIGREAKLWTNTGTALGYAGLYREGMACHEKAISLADLDPVARELVPGAYAALAGLALNVGETSKGLWAIQQSIQLSSEPGDAIAVHSRVLAEKIYTQLLIEVHDCSLASLRAAQARFYANKSNSPRSDIQASVAEGLAETFSGNLDVGISRLTSALERCKSRKIAYRELLVALVKALEHAGRHDEALTYLQEMLAVQRRTAETNALRHVSQHLAKLHSDGVGSRVEDAGEALRMVETHVEVIEGRVAKAEVLKQRQELFRARVETMERLAVAAELRDDATGQHSYRVGRLACLLAKEVGCDEETSLMIDIAARLHDVGKIGIPDGILLKPSAFTPAERSVMETHSEIGADVLAKSEIPHIKMAEEIARHHHERWDGNGYPAKIGGQEIPLAARITALADVFDALTHKRSYKPAWSDDAALSEIYALQGRHFDPELTRVFIALVLRLKREHKSLDFHLGEAARKSPFLLARSSINDKLALARPHDPLQYGDRAL